MRFLDGRISLTVLERPLRLFDDLELFLSREVIKAEHWERDFAFIHHLREIELHARGHVEPHRAERLLRGVLGLLINTDL